MKLIKVESYIYNTSKVCPSDVKMDESILTSKSFKSMLTTQVKDNLCWQKGFVRFNFGHVQMFMFIVRHDLVVFILSS